MKSVAMKLRQNEILDDHETFKKMRLLRGLTRESAGGLLKVSRASVQRYETGVVTLSARKQKQLMHAYGFSPGDFINIKTGKIGKVGCENPVRKIRISEHKALRRSYQKKITKDVLAVARLRKKKGISQYRLSHLCGWSKATIGHIEQGRIELRGKKLDAILKALGETKKNFEATRQSDLNRDFIEDSCIRLLRNLDDSKLVSVQTFLKTFSN